MTARSLTERLEAQVKKTPDSVAVIYEERSLRYAELNRMANRVAHHLQALGAGPESIVGLELERSLELMVAVLGVLKAGAAYVPLDPQYPAEWLSHIARDSGATLRLGPEQVRRWSHDPLAPIDDPVSGAGPETLAYLLYTSGSTGKPKGVEVVHRGLLNFLESMRAILDFSSQERLLSVTGLTFDISGLDLYLSWTTGATLILVPRAMVFDGKRLARALEDSQATCLQTTPVTWRALVDAGWHPPRGFKALCGGEAMPEPLFRDLLLRRVHLWNLYGPTETTIWSTAREMTDSAGQPLTERITVGRPIAHTSAFILDSQGQPVPRGEAGELFLGGLGLARGYHGLPQLTAERFVRDPFSADPTARLYRTGDRARFLPNLEIELLGRCDHQIKWHGYRIEPGEVEAALREAAGVKDCVVVLREGPPEAPAEPRIVAYLVSGAPLDLTEVRAKLARLLPAFMMPAALVRLERFPLTPNGKLDRRQLPAPEAECGM